MRQGAAGVVVAGHDATVSQAGAAAVVARGDVHMTGAGASLIAAGHDLELTAGGAAVIAARGDISVTMGGAQYMVAAGDLNGGSGRRRRACRQERARRQGLRRACWYRRPRCWRMGPGCSSRPGWRPSSESTAGVGVGLGIGRGAPATVRRAPARIGPRARGSSCPGGASWPRAKVASGEGVPLYANKCSYTMAA